MANKFLKVLDVAEMLSVSESLIYAYSKNGILPSVALPHSRDSKAVKQNRFAIRFRLEDVEKFIDSLGRDRA